jgi:DNA polymerase-3 subunit gamma/tau
MPAELSRVISLLLAAQTDMRWTTSPRLTLELALVRATMPETDPAPEALIARMERLERLAGVHDGSASAGAPRAEPPVRVPEAATEPAADGPPRSAPRHAAPEPAEPAAAASAEAPAPEPEARPAAPVPAARMPAASESPAQVPSGTAAVDVEMLRRSWQDVLERLTGMMKAVLGTATPVALDDSTLELAFPASMGMRVIKVQEREADLRAVLQELFGISPRIKCVVRDAGGGGAGPAVEVVEEAPPLGEEAVLARLKAEFDATEAPEPEGW